MSTLSTFLRTFTNERGTAMSRKKKTIHKRVWLEPSDPDTLSYVAYTLGQYGEDDLNITLADCNRQINLYFSETKKGRRKLNKLIAVLQEAQEKYNAND